MAARQIYGRTCACQCGASLDGMHQTALYTAACKVRIHNERKRLCNIKRLARLKTSRTLPAKCKTCWDLPWARGPHRQQSDVTEAKVGDSTWHCVGCGEPYAPEPNPEHGSLLSSSAGTAQKAHELWGYQPNLGGADRTKAYREAKKAGSRGS